MFRNGFVFRVIGALLLVGLIAAGGFMAFKAGETQGIAQAPAIATAISEAADNGQAVPPMMYGNGYYPHTYGYGYGMHGFGHHGFGFFPIGGICFSIIFIFLFFGFMKMIFFRRMMWARHGYHGHPWGGPPWMRWDDEENKEKEKKEDNTPEEKK